MIAVRIPKEIRDYKEKLWAGLNARQIVALVAMAGIGVPVYWYGQPILGQDGIENVLCVLLMPIGLVGFFPYQYGMKPEVWFKVLIRYYFIKPKERKFVSKNFFDFRNVKEGK